MRFVRKIQVHWTQLRDDLSIFLYSSLKLMPTIPADTPGSAVPAHAPHRSRATQARVFPVVLGNGFELFDFTAYSFFAALIGRLFFPAADALSSLLMSLATFGVGFIARPLGGVVMGRHADKHGRKSALTLTLGLMALGTALIGLLPTYASIGLAAPCMLVLGRLLQGFAIGGEIASATCYLMESGQPHEQGRRVSWQMASQGLAALFAALCCFALTRALSTAALEAWGWRVPFLAGALIGPLGLYMRRTLVDTMPNAQRSVAVPTLGETLCSYRKEVLQGIGLMVTGTSTTYVVVFFLPSYMGTVLGMGMAPAFLAACVAGCTLAVGSWLVGHLNDGTGNRPKLLQWALLSLLLATYPCFAFLNARPSLGAVLIVVATLVLLLAWANTTGLLMILHAFPPTSRATGVGLVYGIGVTVFGGVAQLTVTWLIQVTGSPMAAAWYLIACQIVSLLTVRWMTHDTAVRLQRSVFNRS